LAADGGAATCGAPDGGVTTSEPVIFGSPSGSPSGPPGRKGHAVGNRSAALRSPGPACARGLAAGGARDQGARIGGAGRRAPRQDAAHREAARDAGGHEAGPLRPLVGEDRPARAADRRSRRGAGRAGGSPRRRRGAAPSQSGERRPRGRQPLPAHLPRERIEHEATCVCPACGSKKLSRIGSDEREVLEYVPSHFKVVAHVQPKMSCRTCETITPAPLPSLPIERGRPGLSLLAHVLVAKYCDHAPLYRPSAIYARAGVELERSTLADWVSRAAFLLEPLAGAITRHGRAGVALHADDRPVPVLDPGRGKTKTGRLWVLVRDERPWAGQRPRPRGLSARPPGPHRRPSDQPDRRPPPVSLGRFAAHRRGLRSVPVNPFLPRQSPAAYAHALDSTIPR
jgi:transposase